MLCLSFDNNNNNTKGNKIMNEDTRITISWSQEIVEHYEMTIDIRDLSESLVDVVLSAEPDKILDRLTDYVNAYTDPEQDLRDWLAQRESVEFLVSTEESGREINEITTTI